MARPKKFDPTSFTIYEISWAMGMSYDKARRFIQKCERHKLIKRVEKREGDRWKRRYSIT